MITARREPLPDGDRDTPRGLLAPALLAAAAIVVLLGVTATALRQLLYLPDPVRIAPVPAAAPRLTPHLVLVVVDGLRYDYATDPAIAPRFADRMRREAHALVEAGRVTMTAAAILTISTGQRADFTQITTNYSTPRMRSNQLLENAHAAGLRAALVGDETWRMALGRFDEELTDANGMAMEIDDSPAMLAAATRIAHEPRPPDLLVVHLIATDHQQHAFGGTSPRYRSFLRRFDEDLARFLDGLAPDTTAIVLSDHGATDNGSHGMDVEVARRTPLFAFGPGIRAGVDGGELDQVDVGYTIAALLGIPGPLQGRGTAAVSLLDVPPRTAAALACADAERIARLVEKAGPADLAPEASRVRAACRANALSDEPRGAAARALVRRYDATVDGAEAEKGRVGVWLIAALALAFLALAAALAPRLALPTATARATARFAAAATAVAAAAVLLTRAVERLPFPTDDGARVALLLAGNGALLALALRPATGALLFRRRPAVALALLPGTLAWSYPSYTAPESVAALALAAAAWALALRSSTERPSLAALALPAAAIALLAPFGFSEYDALPAAVERHPTLLLAAGLALIALWLFAFADRDRDLPPRARLADAALAASIACGTTVLRRWLPPAAGLALLPLAPALAAVALARRRRTLALGLFFAAYALVSRDVELPAVAAAALVAESLARAASRHAPATDSVTGAVDPFAAAACCAGLFAAAFLARMGLQRGLDFMAMDWAAGAFADPSVSALRIGVCLAWKYAAAALLLLAAALPPLAPALRRTVLALLLAVATVRACVLAAILFVCRGSYYPCLRALSDFPPSALLALACALALVATAARPSPAR